MSMNQYKMRQRNQGVSRFKPPNKSIHAKWPKTHRNMPKFNGNAPDTKPQKYLTGNVRDKMDSGQKKTDQKFNYP